MTVIEISCVHVWREISNYVDGDLDPGLRERMEAHFKTCAHCSAILDGTKNLIGLVADGRAFDLPKGFSERLKQRLVQSLPKR
jgi:anti-sigma factor RsiW